MPERPYAHPSHVRTLVIAFTLVTVISVWIIGAKTISEYAQAQRVVAGNVRQLAATAGNQVATQVRQIEEEVLLARATRIAAELDAYLTHHPDKDIRQLQEDDTFAGNAVSNVGRQGYSFVCEQESRIIRFHPDPTVVNQLTEQTALRTSPVTANDNVTGEQDAQRVPYTPGDSEGQGWYTAAAEVHARTADGKGLVVCVRMPEAEALQRTRAMTSRITRMGTQMSQVLTIVGGDARRTMATSLYVLAGSVVFLLAVGGWMLLRNEQLLVASEAWHRSLVDQALVGMFVYQDGRFRFLNRRIADIFGYQPKELLGEQLLTVLRPDYCELVAQMVQTSAAGEQVPGTREVEFITKGGDTGWADLSVSVIPGGSERRVIVNAVDITERKRAEERLRQRLAVAEAVAETSKELLSPEEADLDKVLQRLGGAMEVSRAGIFLLRDDATRVDNTHEWCRKGVSSLKGTSWDMTATELPWWMEMLAEGHNVIIPDVDALPEEFAAEQASFRERDIHALACVPIHSAGASFIGFIGFCDTRASRDWHRENVQALRLVAEILGSHWDRERAEAGVVQRQEMLHAVMRLSTDRAFAVDEDGRYVDAFGDTEKATGLPADQIIGRLMDDVLPAYLAQQLLATIRETIRTNANQSTEYQLTIEGQEKWFEGRTCLMPSVAGQKRLVIWTCHDIVPQKEAEQRLQIAERKFRAFTEQSLHPVWVVQGEEIVYSNSAMSMQLGLDCGADATGMDLEDIVCEEMWPGIAEKLSSLMAGEIEAERTLIKFSALPGQELWHDVQFARIEYEGGPAALATSQDITETKTLMEELNAERLHDSLTGLYNRRYFNDVVVREVQHSDRYGVPMSLLMLDIDGFKSVNDTHGHLIGDEVLRAVAGVLLKHVRGADIPIRFGGDEFLIIMHNATAATAEATAVRLAKDLVEHLQERTAAGELPDDVHTLVWLSGGAATYRPGSGQSLDDVLRRADDKMYAHKEENRRWRDRRGKPPVGRRTG